MKQRLLAGLLCIFVLFSVFPLFSQDAGGGEDFNPEELQKIKNTIKTAVIEHGEFREDLFGRVMSGRLLTEVDALTDEILNAYINERLQQGGAAIPELHAFFFEFYTDAKKAAILGNFARFGIFNRLAEDFLAHLEAALTESAAEEEITFAVESYKALRLYKTVEEKSAGDWEEIFERLLKAYSVRPLRTNTGVLREAAKEAGRRRVLFEVTAYDYYDKGGPSLFRRTGLFLRHLFTPEKHGGVRKELAVIREKLRTDILAAVERNTPADLPRLESVRLFSLSTGEEVVFSSTDERSSVYGKQFVLAFFSTTCGSCVEELAALGGIIKDRIKIAAVNTNLANEDIFLQEMPEYIDQTGVRLDFYTNTGDMNSLVSRYGVTSVPVLLLFDRSGSPAARVQFNHLGHIRLKLGWVLEEYLDFTL
jgi:thiol-disulfide isomerase/thioredoxin